jgi:hypothetical protein
MSNIRRFVVLGAMLAAGGIALPAQAATGHLICRGSDDSTVNLTSIDNAAGDVAVSWGFEKYAGTASSIKANGVSNHNKGSIFDPAMIFHFYVNISASSELSLYKTTWAAFPYPGR